MDIKEPGPSSPSAVQRAEEIRTLLLRLLRLVAAEVVAQLDRGGDATALKGFGQGEVEYDPNHQDREG